MKPNSPKYCMFISQKIWDYSPEHLALTTALVLREWPRPTGGAEAMKQAMPTITQGLASSTSTATTLPSTLIHGHKESKPQENEAADCCCLAHS